MQDRLNARARSAARHRRRILFPYLLLAPLCLQLGCAFFEQWVAPLEDVVERRASPEPAYEKLFPYYVEVCAVTQYRRLDGRIGGIPGHAVMYIKGICRDPDAPYPRLMPCERIRSNVLSKGHGAGISVNRMFKNVNWMAVPGKRLFLDGELEPNERLTRAHYDEVLDEAVELGVFRGIEIHDRDLKKRAEGEDLERFIAEKSIGTDFALRFARTIYCTVMPIEEAQALALMEILNGINDEYASGEADYNWNGYSDNCVHIIYNSLAGVSVWKGKNTTLLKLREMLDFAVPANAVIDLASRGLTEQITNPKKVHGDEYMRATLGEYGWLPTRHGVLMEVLPIHQDNELFDTRPRSLVLSRPFGYGANGRASHLLRDGRATELEANLRFFRHRYEEALATREDPPRPLFGGDAYDETLRRYYPYMEAQLAEVEEMLARLSELRLEAAAKRMAQ